MLDDSELAEKFNSCQNRKKKKKNLVFKVKGTGVCHLAWV